MKILIYSERFFYRYSVCAHEQAEEGVAVLRVALQHRLDQNVDIAIRCQRDECVDEQARGLFCGVSA